MIQQLVTAELDHVQLFHVRLAFSESMQSVGKMRIGKGLHLLKVVLRAINLALRNRISILYFSPAGPNLVPLVRDLLLLPLLRPFFAKTIFHFHAAGVSELLQSQPRLLRALARAAYGNTAGAIQTSALNPSDAAYFGARSVAVIPNGLKDEALPYLETERPAEDKVRILSVGVICESKGAFVLLEAARQLAQRRSDFTVWFVGQFASVAFQRKARDFCQEHGLEEVVSFLGRKIDGEKWECFRRADVLCFPSFFEAESFGNVAVEGMMFGLPVVATRWRGIPDVVEDGETGLLVPIRDASSLAGALERLLRDDDLRRSMGRRGRQKYLEQYTLPKHLERMDRFLYEVAVS